MTFALLLNLIRRIPEAVEFSKENKWTKWDPEIFLGEELINKTIGIIGFGKIGQAVARRALGFGLNIIYYNHSIKKIDPKISNNLTSLDFNQVLESSDYLTLHLPLTIKTKKLINAETFSLMKKNPIIINMSRGEIVDTNDLTAALKSGQVRGAALDVTDPEPLPSDNELYKINNCIITPHIGTATIECRNEMAIAAANNIINNLK